MALSSQSLRFHGLTLPRVRTFTMPRRGKKRAKSNSDNEKSPNAADLSSPLQLLGLDTPASTSSLAASPSNLTSVPSSPTPTAVMDPYAMNSHDEMHLSEGPPADVHSKLGKASRRISATNAISSFHSAFSSSKVMQQVLGIQSPEPYPRPPPCPPDLEDQFVRGMKLYEIDLEVPGENPLETLSRAAAATEQKETSHEQDLSKYVLKRMAEETEGPARSMNETGAGEVSTDMKTGPPAWNSRQLASINGSRTFTKHDQKHYDQNWDVNDRLETNNSNVRPYTAASDIHYEDDYHSHPHAGFGSTTTLVDSEPSRPGSSAFEHQGRTAWQKPDSMTNATQMNSFTPAGYGTNHGADVEPPSSSSSLTNSKHHLSCRSEGKLPNFHDDAHVLYGGYGPPQHIGSTSQPLFPSPCVEPAQSWDEVNTSPGGQAPPSTLPIAFTAGQNTSGTQMHYADGPHDELSVPQIHVEPPSPAVLKSKKKNKYNNRKRSATFSQEAPPAKARTDDSTLGLPVLAVGQEALWKSQFPGNTEALLTIILPWSLSMNRLFTAYPDPKRFSLNSAFPYKVTPPLHIKLVSAAFYDLGMPPHKEIRFLGPADAVDISYNEVDIFAYPDNSSTSVPTEHDRAKNAMKRALGLPVLPTNYKYMPMHQRAATGEGRWAYILLQGHRPSPKATPPHAMIAWQVSAVTDSSDCMHFVYPDAYMVARRSPLLAPKVPRRFSSLQNLAQRFIEPKRLHQELRAASSEELPGVGGKSGEGAVVLKRRVIKMEKAGRTPLIEGFRVDVRKWEGWMEAVGRGKGKVIMWMEKE
jgi:hypothetical protein